MPMFRGWSKQL